MKLTPEQDARIEQWEKDRMEALKPTLHLQKVAIMLTGVRLAHAVIGVETLLESPLISQSRKLSMVQSIIQDLSEKVVVLVAMGCAAKESMFASEAEQKEEAVQLITIFKSELAGFNKVVEELLAQQPKVITNPGDLH